MPMQSREFFSAVKIQHFNGKNFDIKIFNIFAQNIHCGWYILESPWRGGSNDIDTDIGSVHVHEI